MDDCIEYSSEASGSLDYGEGEIGGGSPGHLQGSGTDSGGLPYQYKQKPSNKTKDSKTKNGKPRNSKTLRQVAFEDRLRDDEPVEQPLLPTKKHNDSDPGEDKVHYKSPKKSGKKKDQILFDLKRFPRNTLEWQLKLMEKKYMKLELRYKETKKMLKTAIKTL